MYVRFSKENIYLEYQVPLKYLIIMSLFSNTFNKHTFREKAIYVRICCKSEMNLSKLCNITFAITEDSLIFIELGTRTLVPNRTYPAILHYFCIRIYYIKNFDKKEI